MRPHSNSVDSILLVALWFAIALAGCSRNSGQSAVDQGEPNSDSTALPGVVTASKSSPAPDSTEYVGSQRCVSCHQQRHESYLLSHHSRSLTRVDVTAEESGQTLDHPPSNRSYEIVRRDGKL